MCNFWFSLKLYHYRIIGLFRDTKDSQSLKSNAHCRAVAESPPAADVRLAAFHPRQVQFSRRLPCPVLLFVCSVIGRKTTVRVKSTAPFARGSKTSSCARTAYTTAPTAGKHVMSPQRMSGRIDSKIIELQVDPDERLAAAVCGAARYLADAAGLGIESVVQMQKAIVSACQEAFEHLAGNHPHLEVTLTRYADRIEVALAYQGGAAPAVGLDRIAGMAQGLGIWSRPTAGAAPPWY